MSLKFTIIQDSCIIKEINVETVPLEDFDGYRKSLKSFQQSVNSLLTELVNKDKTASVKPEEDEYLSGSDSEEEKSSKRNLSNDRVSQKNKVKKH